MKLGKFLQVIKSKFYIRDLVNTVRTIQRAMAQTDLPCWNAAKVDLKTLKSEDAKKWDKIVQAGVKGTLRGNTADLIYEGLVNAQKILAHLENNLSSEYDHQTQELVKDGLSVRRATIIQYIDAMRLFSDYGRRVLHWLVVKEEAATWVADVIGDENTFSAGELKRLDEELPAFIHALKLSHIEVKDLEEALTAIPEVTGAENTEELVGRTVGMNVIDPFAMRNFNYTSTPFYWVGMRIAEWQVYWYDRAVEDQRVIESRLLRLRQRKRGNTEADPKLDAQIEYNEERLARVKGKIRDKEERYGI